jgi:uncharacterized protein YbjT (DUF2867 family)
MKKISFFGATGMLGKPVLHEFIKKGYEVTALTRDIDKAMRLFPENVNWIQGDLSETEKVDETIKGSQLVYVNLAVSPTSRETDFQPEREGISSILRSAKWNDVSRIVYMSSLIKFYEGMNDFHWWVFEMKHHAIDKIKRSGIAYIVFNPSTFMESYSEGGFLSDQKIMVVGKSKHPNWLIAGADFAKMAIKAIENIGEDEDKEYVVQGPEGLTLDKAASFFVSNYTRSQLKITHYPLSTLKFLGMLNRKYNYGANVMEAMNNYPETFQSEEVWQELGKPTTTFKEFIHAINQGKEEVDVEDKKIAE